MEHEPPPPDDDIPARIEAARAAASADRRAKRALFERYVALGINPGDAEAVIEFAELLQLKQVEGDLLMERHHANEEGHPAADQERYEAPVDRAAAHDEPRSLPPDEPSRRRVETAPDPPPRIFLADDGAFAQDVGRGRWLDATVDADELMAVRDELLASSPFGGDSISLRQHGGFRGLTLDAQEDLATVSRLANGVASHGRAFVAYVEWLGRDEETLANFAQYFVGSWASVGRWAESVVEERGWWEQLNEQVDPVLLPHLRIDFERLGRELTYDHYVVEEEDDTGGQIYVFRQTP